MSRATFDAAGGAVSGWVQGDGPPVLLLHGGPGLSFTYLDGLADELGRGWTIAGFQQRGLEPSSTEGPFSVAGHVADAVAVLDALGWDRAVVVGHSWGGHLGLHLALAAPERVRAFLAVDPLGAVGDGGERAFEAEMLARTPEGARRRAADLDERALRGEGTEEEALESLALLWPAYFARPEQAPPMPPMRMSVECYAQTLESLHAEMPELERRLGEISVPVAFVHGGDSPMPISASEDAATRIAGAWVDVVPGAGHMIHLEQPGSVRAAILRLA